MLRFKSKEPVITMAPEVSGRNNRKTSPVLTEFTTYWYKIYFSALLQEYKACFGPHYICYNASLVGFPTITLHVYTFVLGISKMCLGYYYHVHQFYCLV